MQGKSEANIQNEYRCCSKDNGDGNLDVAILEHLLFSMISLIGRISAIRTAIFVSTIGRENRKQLATIWVCTYTINFISWSFKKQRKI
jgi:hypothetical protein